MKKIFIIAGEASGDLHGANLIHALKNLSPDIEIYGVGGDKIRETGAREFFDLAHFHVTGLTQAILKIPDYFKAEKKILASLEKARPDAIVLIDNPGFNLHLAKKIHAMGLPVIYFIAPQLWAWKSKRIFKIKKWVRKVLVVFDFELPIYERNGIDTAFVGHPLKDLIGADETRKPKDDCVALMPGSRKHEVSVLLPEFLKAAEAIQKKYPAIRFRLIEAPTLSPEFYKVFLEKCAINIERTRKDAYQAIRKAKLALVCSGTATLECAMLGTPPIICNKASFGTYLFVKSQLKIPYLGLPNIILNKPAFAELLQYRCTPENIAKETLKILEDRKVQAEIQADLEAISKKLGDCGASRRAAQEILKLMN